MSKESDPKSSENLTAEDLEIETINDQPQADSVGSAELQQELEQAKNDLLYLRAEFDNFRKNSIKERSDLLKFGPERMARELLDVIDTFELALSSEVNAENIDSFIKGMEMTSTNLKSTLSKFGIQEMNPLGENFDPSLHEALSSEPTDQYEPGKVCRVFKKAYKMHDRLLRPAQVVVATEPPTSENSEH